MDVQCGLRGVWQVTDVVFRHLIYPEVLVHQRVTSVIHFWSSFLVCDAFSPKHTVSLGNSGNVVAYVTNQ